MYVDNQTLRDLEIFRADENSDSLFGLADKTITTGGSYRLRQKFLNPPENLHELQLQQETINFLTKSKERLQLNLRYNSYRMKSIEEYIESNINVIENTSLLSCLVFYFTDIEAYRYVRNSLKEITEFVLAFNETLTFNVPDVPILLQRIHERVNVLVSDSGFQESVALKNKSHLQLCKVLRSDRVFRTHLKKSLREITEYYYEVDALLSMAKVTSEKNYCFPVITDKNDLVLQAEGLFHPLLKNAVPYNISIGKESGFVFLTGPNMSGKTTFLKTAGIAVYLAHLGMGIPAKSARLCYFDRLLSSLNITDSIASGYSFFYSEVRRVKQLAEYLSRGEKVLAIFDELFRGTNVRDAYEASLLVISGLVRWKRSMFFLSSHLWEIWDSLKSFGSIRDLYFESEIKNGKPVFTYKLAEGVSDMRLGLTIIENEKIMELLNTPENVKD